MASVTPSPWTHWVTECEACGLLATATTVAGQDPQQKGVLCLRCGASVTNFMPYTSPSQLEALGG